MSSGASSGTSGRADGAQRAPEGQAARQGALAAVAAFTIWGLHPLYFLQVLSVPPLELLLHRALWTLAFVALVLALARRWRWLAALWRRPRELLYGAATAALLSAHWLIYVLAVQRGEVVEASLGYFMNPLIAVVLGVWLLGERLRRSQWLAVALAAVGVAWVTWQVGRLPWMGLALGLTFGFYGLLRKASTLGPIEGLALETAWMALAALPALAWLTAQGRGAWASGDAATIGWLMLAGPVSAIPLALFAAAARRLPFAMVGMVQYLSPSLQLLLGLTVFGEPFGSARLVGFIFIWAALALLSAELWRRHAAQ